MDIPRLSPKEYVVLDLLISNGKMYGLEMVNAAPNRLQRGTVYVTLKRMSEKGYVDSETVRRPDQSGKPRRIFQATGHGQRVYHMFTELSRIKTDGTMVSPRPEAAL